MNAAFKSLAAGALTRAEQDVAARVRETPPYSNHGPRVERYQHAAGISPGDPYCAAAVYTWYEEAARDLGIPNPLVRTGYCPALVAWAKQQGRVRPPAQARPGDILVLHIPSLGRFGHTGLVKSNPGNGTLITCEANTNNNGAREGDGVYQKVRAVAGTQHVCLTMQDYGASATATKAASQDMHTPFKDVQLWDADGHTLLHATSGAGLIGPNDHAYVRADALGALLSTALTVRYGGGVIQLQRHTAVAEREEGLQKTEVIP